MEGYGITRPLMGKQPALLGEKADAGSGQSTGWRAEQLDRAGIWLQQSHDTAQGRAFSGAIDADKAGDGAGGNRQGNAGNAIAARVSPRERRDFQQVCAFGHAGTRAEPGLRFDNIDCSGFSGPSRNG